MIYRNGNRIYSEDGTLDVQLFENIGPFPGAGSILLQENSVWSVYAKNGTRRLINNVEGSISFYVDIITGLAANRYLLDMPGLELYLNSAGTAIYLDGAPYSTTISGWTLITVSWSASETKVYVGKDKIISAAGRTLAVPDDGLVYFGCDSNKANQLYGYISEIRIDTRECMDNDVVSRYNMVSAHDTGTTYMDGSFIKAGIIQSRDGKNEINIDNGTFSLANSKLTFDGDSLLIGSSDGDRIVLGTDGTIQIIKISEYGASQFISPSGDHLMSSNGTLITDSDTPSYYIGESLKVIGSGYIEASFNGSGPYGLCFGFNDSKTIGKIILFDGSYIRLIEVDIDGNNEQIMAVKDSAKSIKVDIYYNRNIILRYDVYVDDQHIASINDGSIAGNMYGFYLNKAASVSNYYSFGDIGVMKQLVTDIDSTKIDGGNIYTGSISANKISVINLEAISASMGTLTAGKILSVSEGTSIELNADAQKLQITDGTNDIFLGISEGLAQFNISDKLIFDGVNLYIKSDDGTTGGWTVTPSTIESGKIVFDSSAERIYVNGIIFGLISEDLYGLKLNDQNYWTEDGDIRIGSIETYMQYLTSSDTLNLTGNLNIHDGLVTFGDTNQIAGWVITSDKLQSPDESVVLSPQKIALSNESGERIKIEMVDGEPRFVLADTLVFDESGLTFENGSIKWDNIDDTSKENISPYIVKITSNNGFNVTRDLDAGSVNPASITLTANVFRAYNGSNITDNCSHSWKIDGVESSTSSTLTIDTNITSSKVIEYTAVYDGKSVYTSFNITYSELGATGTPGEHALSAFVDPAAFTIKKDIDRVFTGPVILTARLFVGQIEQTCTYQWKKGAVILGTGKTLEVSGSDDVSGTYTCDITYDSDVYTVTSIGSLVIDGPTGATGDTGPTGQDGLDSIYPAIEISSGSLSSVYNTSYTPESVTITPVMYVGDTQVDADSLSIEYLKSDGTLYSTSFTGSITINFADIKRPVPDTVCTVSITSVYDGKTFDHTFDLRVTDLNYEWLKRWNNQTLIGTDYIATPDLFSGVNDGGNLTGVRIDSDGVRGYNDSDIVFNLDNSGNLVVGNASQSLNWNTSSGELTITGKIISTVGSNIAGWETTATEIKKVVENSGVILNSSDPSITTVLNSVDVVRLGKQSDESYGLTITDGIFKILSGEDVKLSFDGTDLSIDGAVTTDSLTVGSGGINAAQLLFNEANGLSITYNDSDIFVADSSGVTFAGWDIGTNYIKDASETVQLYTSGETVLGQITIDMATGKTTIGDESGDHIIIDGGEITISNEAAITEVPVISGYPIYILDSVYRSDAQFNGDIESIASVVRHLPFRNSMEISASFTGNLYGVFAWIDNEPYRLYKADTSLYIATTDSLIELPDYPDNYDLSISYNDFALSFIVNGDTVYSHKLVNRFYEADVGIYLSDVARMIDFSYSCDYGHKEEYVVDSDRTLIDGGSILTNSITANKISVFDLSAINADMGTLTAGVIRSEHDGNTIELSADDMLLEFEDSYGTKMFMGFLDGIPTFNIADKLVWDNTELYIEGNGEFTGTIWAYEGNIGGFDLSQTRLMTEANVGGENRKAFFELNKAGIMQVNMTRPYNAEAGEDFESLTYDDIDPAQRRYYLDYHGDFRLHDSMSYDADVRQLRIGDETEYLLYDNGNLYLSGTLNAADGIFTGKISVDGVEIGDLGDNAGIDIDAHNYWLDNGTFKVGNENHSLLLSGGNLTLTGDIETGSGHIGGWAIDSTTITSTNDKVILNSAGIISVSDDTREIFRASSDGIVMGVTDAQIIFDSTGLSISRDIIKNAVYSYDKGFIKSVIGSYTDNGITLSFTPLSEFNNVYVTYFDRYQIMSGTSIDYLVEGKNGYFLVYDFDTRSIKELSIDATNNYYELSAGAWVEYTGTIADECILANYTGTEWSFNADVITSITNVPVELMEGLRGIGKWEIFEYVVASAFECTGNDNLKAHILGKYYKSKSIDSGTEFYGTIGNILVIRTSLYTYEPETISNVTGSLYINGMPGSSVENKTIAGWNSIDILAYDSINQPYINTGNIESIGTISYTEIPTSVRSAIDVSDNINMYVRAYNNVTGEPLEEASILMDIDEVTHEGYIKIDSRNFFLSSSGININSTVPKISIGSLETPTTANASGMYAGKVGSDYHVMVGTTDETGVQNKGFKFDGTDLTFYGGAIKWANLDDESQQNISGYRIELTNKNTSVYKDLTGVNPASVSSTASLIRNIDNVEIVNTTENTTNLSYAWSGIIYAGTTFELDSDNYNKTITVNTSAQTGPALYQCVITYGSLTFTEYLSIAYSTKGETGSDAVIYYLEANKSVVVHDTDNNTYDGTASTSIVFTAYKVVGETITTATGLYWKLNNSATTPDVGNEHQLTVNVSSCVTNTVEIYEDDLFANRLDVLTVPVISDGSSALSVFLTNEHQTVASNTDGTSPSPSTVSIGAKVYKGTTDITSSHTLYVGAAAQTNPFSYIIPNDSTMSGTVSVTVKNTSTGVVIATKDFTWSKSAKGVTGPKGEDAIYAAASSDCYHINFNGSSYLPSQNVVITPSLIKGTAAIGISNWTAWRIKYTNTSGVETTISKTISYSNHSFDISLAQFNAPKSDIVLTIEVDYSSVTYSTRIIIVVEDMRYGWMSGWTGTTLVNSSSVVSPLMFAGSADVSGNITGVYATNTGLVGVVDLPNNVDPFTSTSYQRFLLKNDGTAKIASFNFNNEVMYTDNMYLSGGNYPMIGIGTDHYGLNGFFAGKHNFASGDLITTAGQESVPMTFTGYTNGDYTVTCSSISTTNYGWKCLDNDPNSETYWRPYTSTGSAWIEIHNDSGIDISGFKIYYLEGSSSYYPTHLKIEGSNNGVTYTTIYDSGSPGMLDNSIVHTLANDYSYKHIKFTFACPIYFRLIHLFIYKRTVTTNYGFSVVGTNEYFKWDGSNLNIKGNIIADAGYIGGENGWVINSGYIASSGTSEYGGQGIWLGNSGTSYKMSMVNSDGSKYFKWDGSDLNIKGNLILGYGESAIHFEDAKIDLSDGGQASYSGCINMKWSPLDKTFVRFNYYDFETTHSAGLLIDADYYNGSTKEGEAFLKIEACTGASPYTDMVTMLWRAGTSDKIWAYTEGGNFEINGVDFEVNADSYIINGFAEFADYIKFDIPTWYGTDTTAINRYPNWTDWTDPEDCPHSNIWLWLKSRGTPYYVLYVKSPHDSSTYSYWVALNRVAL